MINILRLGVVKASVFSTKETTNNVAIFIVATMPEAHSASQ